MKAKPRPDLLDENSPQGIEVFQLTTQTDTPAGDCEASRSAWVLWHLREGTAEFRTDGKTTRLRAGAAWLSAPGDRTTLAPRPVAQVLVFDLAARNHRQQPRGAWWREPYGDTRPEPPLSTFADPPPARIFAEPWREAADKLLAQVLVRWWKNPAQHRLASAELGLFLARWLADDREPADPVARFEELARSRLVYGDNVTDICRLIGLSPARMGVHCQQLRGCSAGDLLDRLRLELAERLLRDTTMPVATVAGCVGYRDTSAFIRHFRRTHGCTAEVWRRQQRAQPNG